MMPRVSLYFLPVILLSAMVACRDEPVHDVSPEILLERAGAFRQACAAQELVGTAEENLEMLEATAALYQEREAGGGMLAPVAAVEFSRAYHRHAELRSTVYALLDSAVNHSAGRADSLGYVDRANAFSIRPPDAGTVEANVIESYENDIIRILSDNDHRCNWDIPGLESE